MKDSCTVKIMNAQTFNSALKFPEKGIFSPKFCILRPIF